MLFINQSRQSRPNARRALGTLVTGTIDDTDVKKFNTFDMECESTTTVDADVEKPVFSLKIDLRGHERAVRRDSMETIRLCLSSLAQSEDSFQATKLKTKRP